MTREEAIAILTETQVVYFAPNGKQKAQEALDMAIEALSEPKTGKWVRLERDENVHDLHGVPTWGVNYMCDKCGFITTAIQDHFAQYKWCPSCGADMRKGGDTE